MCPHTTISVSSYNILSISPPAERCILPAPQCQQDEEGQRRTEGEETAKEEEEEEALLLEINSFFKKRKFEPPIQNPLSEAEQVALFFYLRPHALIA
jgi:hypothetical protein